jgi:hypothetical protein
MPLRTQETLLKRFPAELRLRVYESLTRPRVIPVRGVVEYRSTGRLRTAEDNPNDPDLRFNSRADVSSEQIHRLRQAYPELRHETRDYRIAFREQIRDADERNGLYFADYRDILLFNGHLDLTSFIGGTRRVLLDPRSAYDNLIAGHRGVRRLAFRVIPATPLETASFIDLETLYLPELSPLSIATGYRRLAQCERTLSETNSSTPEG